jgi:TRAP-type mannitol/chloroaromatic compound transport system permease small subunit
MNHVGKGAKRPVMATLAMFFGWGSLATLCAFLVNSVLTNWFHWPGTDGLRSERGPSGLTIIQSGLYAVGILGAIALARSAGPELLRPSAERISKFNAFLVRAAFWVVLLVGIVDASVSFLRVEGILEVLVGEQLVNDLGKSSFRGPYLHGPLVLIGIFVAAFTRTLGFIWLAFLVVIAELIIVFSRFIFSYEQPLMADLVRFWYGALFLFASAFTLLEDAHVRVDLLYAGFSQRAQGKTNAFGAIMFGMVFCWVIILFGMGGASSTINGPIMIFEITQAGFGMFTKYMLAGFLGVFAVTMLIQFVAMLFEAVADILHQPGRRTARQNSH